MISQHPNTYSMDWPAKAETDSLSIRFPQGTGVAVRYTHHGLRRMAQRGVSRDMVRDTLDFGSYVFKQGLEYFMMRDCDVKKRFSRSYAGRLKGLVVVLGGDGAVITAYKNRGAFRAISKKAKRLSKS